MPERIRRKWRPPLALVLGCTLLVVVCLPLIGINLLYNVSEQTSWETAKLLIGALIILGTTGIGYVLWRVLLHPITTLADRAKAITDGQPNALTPLSRYGTAELRDLGQAVLDMGGTLQDREAGLRAYTSHVTHELKSPLTSIIAASELLSNDTAPEDRAHLTATICESAKTMQTQLDALRRLARARDPVGRGPSRLSKVVADIREGVELRLVGDVDLPVDASALVVVISHLAQNAIAHGADCLTLTCEEIGFTARDNGTGIAPGNRSRVFDPFFTTRREGGGTGMGLAIVRTMLQAAGGEIELADADRGAAFRVQF